MTAYDVRISDWSSDVCSSVLFAGRVTEGVKARLLDIGDELHRAVVRLVVWHPKNLGDALCQRQVVQRQLFAHEHRDGEIAGGLSLHDFSADGKAIDAVAPQQLIEGVRSVHEFTALAQAGSSHCLTPRDPPSLQA